MNQNPKTPPWGFFALVSYIPDPLGSLLHELRQALPGDDNPRPHITILPPRPLKLPIEAASKQARKILRQFPPFEVELSRVSRFSQTDFLYLDVGDGGPFLHHLHDALNTGDLNYLEELEFRPHLTLGGPVSARNLEATQEVAEAAWHSLLHLRRFTLDEVAALWLSPGNGQGQWERVWSHRLREPRTEALRLPAAAAVTSQTS